jgi:hypothetical protein
MTNCQLDAAATRSDKVKSRPKLKFEFESAFHQPKAHAELTPPVGETAPDRRCRLTGARALSSCAPSFRQAALVGADFPAVALHPLVGRVAHQDKPQPHRRSCRPFFRTCGRDGPRPQPIDYAACAVWACMLTALSARPDSAASVFFSSASVASRSFTASL